MPRAFILVLDSVGVGGATDAADFGDEGANTLLHIAEACAEGRADEGRSGPLTLPNFAALGLGRACEVACGVWPPGIPPAEGAICGAAEEISPGKDTITGHWEISGVPVQKDWGYFPETQPCFPTALTDALIARCDLPGILGNRHASGTQIIEELAAESVATGKPIAYTSADSVIQIAAHEEAFGLERLYDVCAVARELVDPLNIARSIARPFVGDAASGFKRTPRRRDYAVPPPEPTIGDRVMAAGGRAFGIGKIKDILAGKGVSDSLKGPDDMALLDLTLEAMDQCGDGDFIFANYVDFDTEYGHRRDVAGYARALERFDARVPEILARLRDGDVLIVTGDHGNDPTWRGTDHTRERTPILCAVPGRAPADLGIRRFADIGETAAAALGLAPGRHGTSFL